MIKTGIVSVTFRNLPTDEIISLTKSAGLDGIEFGGDIHVPHGNIQAAEKAYLLTNQNSLSTASYGSYYRLGVNSEDRVKTEFQKIADTAKILYAPNIRVWAGTKGSSDTNEEQRKKIVSEARILSEELEKNKITLSFEWHGGTLTDTPQSALSMIEEIGTDNAKLYWQPNQFRDFEFNLASLKNAAQYVKNVHVFAWEENKKFPLEHHEYQWRRYIDTLCELSLPQSEHYFLLEFVADNSIEQFMRDAETLKKWIAKI